MKAEEEEVGQREEAEGGETVHAFLAEPRARRERSGHARGVFLSPQDLQPVFSAATLAIYTTQYEHYYTLNPLFITNWSDLIPFHQDIYKRDTTYTY